jgi:hypothetical protein
MANNILEISGGVIVLSNPTKTEIPRVRALFYKLFRKDPEITISGVFGRWNLLIGNPRRVVFAGAYKLAGFVDVDMAELAAVAVEARFPVRLDVTLGTQVKVRFKVPK